jgi:hypothetical protein
MQKVITMSLLLACGTAFATSPLTVRCEAPKGVREKYGFDLSSNQKAESHLLRLKGPSPDGYQSKLMFIVDPGMKKVMVLWIEAGADLDNREQAKKLGLSTPPPPGAEQFDVVSYSPNVIIATSSSAYLYGTITYSLYPKLGAMFMSVQYLETNLRNAVQSFFFATCDFSPSLGVP